MEKERIHEDHRPGDPGGHRLRGRGNARLPGHRPERARPHARHTEEGVREHIRHRGKHPRIPDRNRPQSRSCRARRRRRRGRAYKLEPWRGGRPNSAALPFPYHSPPRPLGIRVLAPPGVCGRRSRGRCRKDTYASSLDLKCAQARQRALCEEIEHGAAARRYEGKAVRKAERLDGRYRIAAAEDGIGS